MKSSMLFASVALLGLMVSAVEAGHKGGRWGDHGVIRADHTMVYDDVVYMGGRVANVGVSGNGSMLLKIFDAQGHLVVSRYSGPGPQGQECEVRWTPATTAPFTIKIVNLQHFDPRVDYDIMFGIGSN